VDLASSTTKNNPPALGVAVELVVPNAVEVVRLADLRERGADGIVGRSSPMNEVRI